MDGVDVVWSNALAEVHRLVVGPIDNNVYIVRCTRTHEATLIDAASEPERLLRVATSLGVTSVVITHGHWDHIGAVGHVRAAGLPVAVRREDADQLEGYDVLLDDDVLLAVGDLFLRTIHTPGHTPGSICFSLEGAPVLFSGDTLFPGGPGNTRSNPDDFATILQSIDERLFRVYPAATTVWPGHGKETTLGAESPHLDEWRARGW